jgi:DNA-binding NarL/FixJ family response regulator
MEIARLLSQGKSNKEIANEMGLAVGTIHMYVSRVFLALGIHNRTLVALWYVESQKGGAESDRVAAHLADGPLNPRRS